MNRLIASALEAREAAYAPYSHFRVGAALRTTSGAVFVGANVENVSLGLTICAERVCVGSALAAGQGKFDCIAIVADTTTPIVPCGACRQVLAEFVPDLRIVSSTVAGKHCEFTLATLLPHPWDGILESST